jgi:hypothetical protein
MIKFDRQLTAALIGGSMALVQPEIARALSAREIGQIAKQIVVEIDSKRIATPSLRATSSRIAAFTKSPRLVTATTSSNRAYEWGATYYFTVSIPENAGVPLQRVEIGQIEGDEITYRLEETHAFEGTHRRPGAELKLGQVTRDKEMQTVSVTFDPPVPPGKTVTIGLNPTRNPADVICLFRVKVFPEGDRVQALDLGVGRLHFYWH